MANGYLTASATPTEGPRCREHTTNAKGTATARGYDAAWDRLSTRARRLQPWCQSCGAVDDLQADHTPEAWERKAAGKPIRLQDISGSVRSVQPRSPRRHLDQGESPIDRPLPTPAQAKFESLTS